MKGDYMNEIFMNYRLFEGEGGGEGAPAMGGEADASTKTEGTGPVYTPQHMKSATPGEFDNVVYGKQESAEPKTEPDTEGKDAASEEDSRKAYDELIKGKYKDFYTQDTQKMIDRRFKETKGLEETVKNQKAIIDQLFDRYKVSDLEGLQKALDDDNAYLEDEAYENGMSLEQYTQYKKLERENKALLESQKVALEEREKAAKLEDWARQADALKAKYPNFNLEEDSKNPTFVNILASGVPMEFAYNAIHAGEMAQNVATAVAQHTEQSVVNNIRSRGMRPSENGASSGNGFTYKTDVSQLSKADRREIARRARAGERIVL
jgi:hypothetical protein